jgi:hypothetical protein
MYYDTELYDSATEYVDDELALQLRDDAASLTHEQERLERALATMVTIQIKYDAFVGTADFHEEREAWVFDLVEAADVLMAAILERCDCDASDEMRLWVEERRYTGIDTLDSLVYEWNNW